MRRYPLIVVLVALFFGTGCLEIEPGMQLPGQECRTTADCADGLVCSERRCRPVGSGGGGIIDDSDVGVDGGIDDVSLNQVEPDSDLNDIDPRECQAGDLRCASDSVAEICVDGFWESRVCSDDQVCFNGRCFDVTCTPGEGQCISETAREVCDLSGQWVTTECNQDFGLICEDGQCVPGPGPDCTSGQSTCLDSITAAFCIDGEWDVLETCGPGFVCDDASCRPEPTQECCPGGCGEGQMCDGCECKDYDMSVCQYQDQPCSVEGQFANGFGCYRYGENAPLRCYGICNTLAPDPDASCPGTDPAVCTFEQGNPNGICLKACGEEQSCADDRVRCVYNDVGPYEGVCWPTTSLAQAGDPCDEWDVFSCSGTALCIEGICEDTCRPFHGGGTDCASGYCLPIGEDIGLCRPDASAGVGCSQEGGACGADATGCFPDGATGVLVCYEFCRVAEGNSDCGPGETCFQYDPQSPIGVCWSP